ncbi:MAG: HU family DNA-binding protein [Prevotella sp.]|nr:HU family DNA-binding protein [Prevotella sp.]
MATVKDIAKVLASRHKLKGAEAERFLQQMVEVINAGLLSDRVVKIKGFGTFKLQAVKDRASVNVNTGERVVIEGHDKVTFTPDSVMKEIINKPFAQFETVVIDDDSPLLKEGFAAMEDEEVGYDDVNPSDDEERFSSTDEQPVVLDEQPVVAVEQPTVADEQPVVADEQPVVADEQPTVAVEQPIVAEEQIVAAVEHEEQSVVEYKQPVVSEEQPAVSDEQPAAPEEEQPVAPDEQPAPTEEQPANPIAPLLDKSIGAPVLKTENLTVLAENVTVVKEKAEEKKQEETTPPVTEQKQELSETGNAKLEDIEQNNIKTETENETDDNTTTEEMEDKNFKYRGLLTNIAIAVIFFALGYWVGNSNILSDIKVTPAKMHEDSVTVSHPKAEKDSAAAETEAPAPAKQTETKAPASASEKTMTATPSETVQPQKQEEKPLTQYNSDARVKTGAYYIIGTETEVTAREGQTLRSISKSYLGPGMECYVEAYNGIKEVKPGQKVKIPKLKMKKIRK